MAFLSCPTNMMSLVHLKLLFPFASAYGYLSIINDGMSLWGRMEEITTEHTYWGSFLLKDSESLSVTEFPVQKKVQVQKPHKRLWLLLYCLHLPDTTSLLSFVWKNWVIALLAVHLFASGMLVLLIMSTALQRLGSFLCYSDHPIFVTINDLSDN